MLTIEDIQKKVVYFCVIVFIFGIIIFGLKKDNHFYGLNESSDILDCIFYTSIVFTGSGYGNIYPQTNLGRTVILILTLIKIFIIVYPLSPLDGEYFTIPDTTTRIEIEDVDSVINSLRQE